MKVHEQFKALAAFSQSETLANIREELGRRVLNGDFDDLPEDRFSTAKQLGLSPIFTPQDANGSFYYPLRPVSFFSHLDERAARRLHDIKSRQSNYITAASAVAVTSYGLVETFSHKSIGAGLLSLALMGVTYMSVRSLHINKPFNNMVGVRIDGDKRALHVVEYYDPAMDKKARKTNAIKANTLTA